VSQVPTSRAVSPDSGEHWSAPGVWQVAPGIHRIPLPLPLDGLRAVNVYVLETPDGLTLVDGGWAVPEGREAFEKGFKALGFELGDISRFLVTHAHRDHYTLASVIARETGATISLGAGDRPTIEMLLGEREFTASTVSQLNAAGAPELARTWAKAPGSELAVEETRWTAPDLWLEGDHRIEVGERTLDAIHTPGHTQGHYVFAARDDGLLFAGDHVLPTITPSIGFEPVPVQQPLRDFMASLTKLRGLPDLRLLPAHGPVWMSSHERIDQLLEHHEERLARCLDALGEGPKTSFRVAADLPWTRHERRLAELGPFDQGLAAMETKAHLELLVARGRATREETPEGVVFALAAPTA